MRIGVEFSQHMVMCVVAVKTDKDSLVTLGKALHLLHNVIGDALSLNHADIRPKRMSFNGGTVMDSDIYVHR